MATNEITTDNLGDSIFSAAKDSFGAKFAAVQVYLKAEAEKLAVRIRMIIEGVSTGDIDKDEAKILFAMEKQAVVSVLAASEGMTLLAVEAAINAALGVVRDFVNGKVGFPLF